MQLGVYGIAQNIVKQFAISRRTDFGEHGDDASLWQNLVVRQRGKPPDEPGRIP
jgi:hypothetical protein